MYEKDHNPFEDHINSEEFDVSKLDRASDLGTIDAEIQAFLDDLPQPLNHELWDTELDERQKIICAYLATELVDRVLRVQHMDELANLSDDQLIYLLTVPVSVAMLAEEHLHRTPQPAKVQVLNHLTAYPIQSQQPPFGRVDWSGVKATLSFWAQRTRAFINRLLDRF